LPGRVLYKGAVEVFGAAKNGRRQSFTLIEFLLSL
jgi:hypothetical protein